MSNTTHASAHLVLATASVEETARLGRRLGAACRGGEVILLEGNLGAGKTTLTQGLGAGLDIVDPVVSPTFILMRVYEGRLPLYHFDFYRLEGSERAVDLEFDEYLEAGGVSVIEWPNCAPELIPPQHLRISLGITGTTTRTVDLHAFGDRYQALLSTLSVDQARSTAAL